LEQKTYLKNRVNRDMPQSLDMPARTTINTNIKTNTITSILFFTMLYFSRELKKRGRTILVGRNKKSFGVRAYTASFSATQPPLIIGQAHG
jgi:hypothetical protein